MPTLPKAVAALFFAALGYFIGDLIRPLLPEGTKAGMLGITLAGIGALCGWYMSGAKAGHGLRAGLGYGLTTVGLMFFWGDVVFSGQKMLAFAIDKRLKGPMNALKSMVGFIMENAVMVATPTIIIAVIVGGLFGGWIVEWVARRFS